MSTVLTSKRPACKVIGVDIGRQGHAMGTRAPSLLCSMALLCASTAGAEIAMEAPGPATPRAAVEVDVLWPVVGISELKTFVSMGRGRSLRSDPLAAAYLEYAEIL